MGEMFPSCSRSLRLSVMNKLIKMTFMDLIFDTNTHKKSFSLLFKHHFCFFFSF